MSVVPPTPFRLVRSVISVCYPLPERLGRQQVLDEVCSGLAHATTQARRAEAAPFAAERHEVLLDARIALQRWGKFGRDSEDLLA